MQAAKFTAVIRRSSNMDTFHMNRSCIKFISSVARIICKPTALNLFVIENATDALRMLH